MAEYTMILASQDRERSGAIFGRPHVGFKNLVRWMTSVPFVHVLLQVGTGNHKCEKVPPVTPEAARWSIELCRSILFRTFVRWMAKNPIMVVRSSPLSLSQAKQGGLLESDYAFN